jgi:glycosyltransferase involved in cell wall biosynthesis
MATVPRGIVLVLALAGCRPAAAPAPPDEPHVAVPHDTPMPDDDPRQRLRRALATPRGAPPITDARVLDAAIAVPRDQLVPAEVRDQLRGRRVLAWIGSVNPSYATAESMTVTRRVLELRDDAVLLVLTRSLEPLQPYLDAAGIDPARVVAASAPHEDMASWLGLVDWGLMLGRRSEGKRASMPTKLAEFLALGVRPVQHGFNDDVDLWVERAGSGVVLSSLHPDELERAAQRIASDDLDGRELDIARERTRGHFDLPSGVERYAWLLSELAR